MQFATTLLVLALVAALLGFDGIAGSFAGIASILFCVFIVLFLMSAAANAFRGQSPV